MRLKPQDFATPLFDINPPVVREFERRKVIEGVTRTDNFKVVGYTYWPGDGTLVIKNTLNRLLFQGKIKDIKGFGKAMKKADKA